jgi:hypothetical protein
LSAAPPSLEATETGDGDLPEPLRKMPGELQVIASITHAEEDFEADLNLRERLDAMIARQGQTSHTNESHETNASPDFPHAKRQTTKKNRRK